MGSESPPTDTRMFLSVSQLNWPAGRPHARPVLISAEEIVDVDDGPSVVEVGSDSDNGQPSRLPSPDVQWTGETQHARIRDGDDSDDEIVITGSRTILPPDLVDEIRALQLAERVDLVELHYRQLMHSLSRELRRHDTLLRSLQDMQDQRDRLQYQAHELSAQLVLTSDSRRRRELTARIAQTNDLVSATERGVRDQEMQLGGSRRLLELLGTALRQIIQRFQTLDPQRYAQVTQPRALPQGYAPNVYTELSHDPMSEQLIKDLLENIKPDGARTTGVHPQALAVTLLPHQMVGLLWMVHMEEGKCKGGMLADDMGLGKTVQAIACIALSDEERQRIMREETGEQAKLERCKGKGDRATGDRATGAQAEGSSGTKRESGSPPEGKRRRTDLSNSTTPAESPVFACDEDSSRASPLSDSKPTTTLELSNTQLAKASPPDVQLKTCSDSDADSIEEIVEPEPKPPRLTHPGPTLVVAPVSLLRQWQAEFSAKLKRSHPRRTFLYTGASSRQVRLFLQLCRYDVVFVLYGTLASEMKRHFASELETLREEGTPHELPTMGSGGAEYCLPFYSPRLRFLRVVLDELQYIKNKNTHAAKLCALVDARFRWCLLGTPMQNSIDELYLSLRFLRIKPYNQEARFRSDLLVPLKSIERASSAARGRAMRRLQVLFLLILLRRTKDSEIDGQPILQLPAKTVNREDVEMGAVERQYYSQLELKTRLEAEELMDKSPSHSFLKTLVLLLRLRQACCHPFLVELGMRQQQWSAEARDWNKTYRSASEMDGGVVARIQERLAGNDEFICPRCCQPPDLEELLVFLTPCGHAVCSDCVLAVFEEGCADDLEEGERTASCLECHKTCRERGIVPFSMFLWVHVNHWPQRDIQREMERRGNNRGREFRDSAIDRLVVEHGGELPKLAKVELCVGLVESILAKEPREKVIVFSQFTLLFHLLQRELDARAIAHLRYDGSMTGEARDACVLQFYRDDSIQVMLLLLKAGNVGLTLTCANHVVIMDPFWNPFVEEQAMDRVHRIGQHKEVQVHRLLVPGTVEDRINTLQERKRELVRGALDEGEIRSVSRIDRAEMMYLLSGGTPP